MLSKSSQTAMVERYFRASFLLLLCFVLSSFFGRSGSVASAENKRSLPLKIGFVMVGPVHDWGWNYAHEQGRLFAESALGKSVETCVVENVPDNAEAERVIEKLIARGNKLIFTTSYGFLESALKEAKRHLEVTFMHIERPNSTPAKNLGTAFCYVQEPVYLAGMVAGRITRSNKIGFIAAHPVPGVLQNINALALGARSVNPKATVHVVWTNNWSDPPTEAEAANSLVDQGADVLAMQQNSPTTIVQTAENRGVCVVGMHADLHQFAPHGWLTGERWNWGPLYLKIIKSVMDKTWQPTNLRYAMKEGYVTISPFGTAVPINVRHEVLAKKKLMEQGQFTVFRGPLLDREGKTRVNKGEELSETEFDGMNWFVPGVQGSLPGK